MPRREPYRVIHVSHSDLAGGAARAAFRIHQGLRASGVDSEMLVANRLSQDESVVSYRPPSSRSVRVARGWQKRRRARKLSGYDATRKPGGDVFSDASGERQSLVEQVSDCDLVHLHWVAGFWDYRNFLELPPTTRVIWTLHDMNAFTGGCHYDRGCGRFRKQCGECPELGSQDPFDFSYQGLRQKRAGLDSFPENRLTIVTPSLWLAQAARESTVLGRFPVRRIPYGLNTEVFAPRDRGFVRQVLGIPEGRSTVLFVADALWMERKGVQILLDALNMIAPEKRPLLLSVGSGKLEGLLQGDHLDLGFIGEERLLSMVYSAADLFVMPSTQENFAQTGLEALACGTPVAGFDTGGLPDLIQDGEQGVLAKPGDPKDLARAILSVLEDPARRERMASASRRLVLKEFQENHQAEAYRDLYAELLGKEEGQ